MKLRTIMIMLFITSLVFVWGCSNNKPTSTNPNPNDTTGTLTTVWNNAGYWQTTVNATSTTHFSYYGFAQKDTLALSDDQARNDPSWNIGFKRSSVILNGGISGSGGCEGMDL